jgi:hypothetical protein
MALIQFWLNQKEARERGISKYKGLTLLAALYVEADSKRPNHRAHD